MATESGEVPLPGTPELIVPRPGGLAVVERARTAGIWDAAYAGVATIESPDDFQAALDAIPAASEMFAKLDGANRYAVLYSIATARRPVESNLRRTARCSDHERC